MILRLEDGGNEYDVTFEDQSIDECDWAECFDGGVIATQDGTTRLFRNRRPGSGGGSSVGDGAILSPMPGRIIAVEVAAGESVAKGQKLVTLEAMKMEHSLTAPFDGVVAELSAEEGGQVSEGALLARVERNDD